MRPKCGVKTKLNMEKDYLDTFKHDSCSSSDSDSDLDPEPEKEVINKEAPEGIEVADFDGLNINEEMS